MGHVPPSVSHEPTRDRQLTPSPHSSAPVPTAEERALLEALRAGDEAAFMTLVERFQSALLRLALTYVHDRAVAEEVVQDTWIGVLKGLDHFEWRASLKTWIFHILINRAKTSAQREGRTIPFSAAWDSATEPDGPSVPPERFMAYDTPEEPKGWWASPPASWGESPEQRMLAAETRAYVADAIAALPPSQREVITLRDVTGCTSEEVCDLLRITEGNQRVLLHRARSKVRQALERYFTQE